VSKDTLRRPVPMELAETTTGIEPAEGHQVN
jgi:hypothetical protein